MAGRPMSKKVWAQRQEELNAYYDERSRWFAVDKNGNRVNEGDKVTTSRGEELEFGGVSAYPTFGKTGKIWVTDPKIEQGKPFHSQEFYPSVINVELRREAKGN